MQRNSNILLVRSLISGLVLHGAIQTTKPKARLILGLTDRLVNNLKKGTNASRLKALKLLGKETVIEKLEKEIVARLKDRKSGYLKRIKIQERAGDNATQVKLSWLLDEEKPKNDKTD